ncbi:unnamed protein product [Schistosoma curassoni]|uniref:Hydroxymethylbilane hydrolyase [cyclizing] n=1 Tax=Schistosoma curassoni TaxID=6186 RepID=A0A183JRN5_9TREM|nr:unnamed protein product [Schistosoma curassoni]
MFFLYPQLISLEKVSVPFLYKLVAMGRATATRLKELGLTVSAVASSPKPESLLTALKQLK